MRYTAKAVNSPPKNKTSVARKIHMPAVLVSRCCSGVPYCSRSIRPCEELDKPEFLLHCFVVIRLASHDRSHFEIVLGGRGSSLPFQPGCAPRIRSRYFPVMPGPCQIAKRQHVT